MESVNRIHSRKEVLGLHLSSSLRKMNEMAAAGQLAQRHAATRCSGWSATGSLYNLKDRIVYAKTVHLMGRPTGMYDHIEEQLRGLIAHGLKVDKDLIQGASKVEDWGGDSLDLIETIFTIDTHFDVNLSDLDIDGKTEFSHIAQYVRLELAKKGNDAL